MNVYQAFFDIKSGTNDLEFAEAFGAYMAHLKSKGLIESYRLLRRKLGFGPEGLGDWQSIVEVKDLAQLEAAFQNVSTRRDPVEAKHFAVNSQIAGVKFALYRDFPDPQRHKGEEKF
ncbi:MAG TPA: DUF6614 family protein [Rhizomicrobium sp.]|nr:DUF6614 family protein [Rhizomicrobium sp.]